MINRPQRQNSLLAAVPSADWRMMQGSFQIVELQHGRVLIEANTPLDRIYFPVVGVLSSVSYMQNGQSVEMATVGVEGMAGIGAILGSANSLSRHVVQVRGHALTIGYRDFVRLRDTVPAFRRILLDYVQAFVVQVLQSVACNAVHPVQDRAARWLLTCDDRADDSSFFLTQQFLGEMLGVSRGMVNTIARTFQRAGLIAYRRGVITILNRHGLENAACECYRLICDAYEQRSIGLGYTQKMADSTSNMSSTRQT